jgi:monofunctional biosynthetic peptidoglycan transglycosylase
VADKDTRDDVEIVGEPVPLPDGPRSEGGPATGGASREVTAPPTAPNASPEIAPAHAEDWHAAIADAIAVPSPPEPEAPRESYIRWVDTARSEPREPEPPAAEPVASETVVEPTVGHETAPVEHTPAQIVPPDPAPNAQAAWQAEADDAAFTDAAADLFRPTETTQDPHLITIGRRLDTSARIARPVPPLIEPRPYDDHPVEVTWQNGTWKDRARIAARYAAYAVGGYLALVLMLILLFRFVDPPGSMLMLRHLLTGNAVNRTWVPLEQISPNLIRAVIVSEDGRFCEHSGIDTAAIKEAIERASGGVPRGASTISMQVTKNLFLWNAKSYIRKVIEIPLTLFMEMVWPKWRVLEVYLNIAEWGPGVFGAEAAARHHFNKPASRLSEREAALLAAVLPNPVARDAGAPGRGTSAKARVVQSRVRAYGAVASCVVSATAAAPAPAATSTTGAKPAPARKPALRTAPRQKTLDEWAPTLNFGPR